MSCPSTIPQTASRLVAARLDSFLALSLSEFARRTLDVSIACFGLLLFAPLWLIVGAAWLLGRTTPQSTIKLGRRFVPFRQFAFAGERRSNRVFVLWNLFAGQITLVGPRAGFHE